MCGTSIFSTTTRLVVVCNVVRCGRNLKDTPIKIAKIVIINEYPVRRPVPHLLAILHIEPNTAIARDSVDLVEERVRWYENAADARETDFDVEVVVHQVHAVA